MAEIEFVDEEWAVSIETGLEEYLAALSYIDDPDYEIGIETESGLPYCGCNVCEIREILTYVIPRAVNAYIEGKIRLDEVDPAQ